MFTCIVCNFKCSKRGDLNRHLQTPKHIRFVAPLQTLQLENEQLKTLVLEQQIELKKQFKRSTSHSPVRRKVFCLNHFLFGINTKMMLLIKLVLFSQMCLKGNHVCIC